MNQDIVAVEISMNHCLDCWLMQIAHSLGDIEGDPQTEVRCDDPLLLVEDGEEWAILDEFSDYRELAGIVKGGTNERDDIGMRKPG